ncbi:uncharacterized protein L969DRAFT_94484 [Mixia osmundae IAM 14324]|uniref:Ricin B lectin domain-containing protein n=1 Tax=Mixia osmundae (strain CBS 9802 / IAM 14324 / JCM 22182 / KY 12970) TaxID=764103 RepID=G7E3M5_MIXOS|nr:uncharacterized protein L969DRAFT_94484 [Mixia osmundae IAM 14324]KEI39417.1 hypothetical protein L969DRAFT_94484 [Mixia osmundae IAM 14324]GAA97435.1 hypothetical protein E5Q_04113 [Mixia osmundae IAM 14324]
MQLRSVALALASLSLARAATFKNAANAAALVARSYNFPDGNYTVTAVGTGDQIVFARDGGNNDVFPSTDIPGTSIGLQANTNLSNPVQWTRMQFMNSNLKCGSAQWNSTLGLDMYFVAYGCQVGTPMLVGGLEKTKQWYLFVPVNSSVPTIYPSTTSAETSSPTSSASSSVASSMSSSSTPSSSASSSSASSSSMSSSSLSSLPGTSTLAPSSSGNAKLPVTSSTKASTSSKASSSSSSKASSTSSSISKTSSSSLSKASSASSPLGSSMTSKSSAASSSTAKVSSSTSKASATSSKASSTVSRASALTSKSSTATSKSSIAMSSASTSVNVTSKASGVFSSNPTQPSGNPKMALRDPNPTLDRIIGRDSSSSQHVLSLGKRDSARQAYYIIVVDHLPDMATKALSDCTAIAATMQISVCIVPFVEGAYVQQWYIDPFGTV